MPSTPEIDHVTRLVRGVEIQRHSDAENTAKADGYVGVSRKVEIDLAGICQDTAPGGGQIRRDPGGCLGKNVRGMPCNAIGKNHLLKEPYSQYGETNCQTVELQSAIALLYLRQNLVVADYRAGDEMREEKDKETIVKETVAADHALPDVHQVCDLGEREERNSQRQDDRFDVPGRARGSRHRIDEEVCVLEISEQRQVGSYPKRQHRFARFAASLNNPVLEGSSPIVEQDRRNNQQHIRRVPPDIEN